MENSARLWWNSAFRQWPSGVSALTSVTGILRSSAAGQRHLDFRVPVMHEEAAETTGRNAPERVKCLSDRSREGDSPQEY